jgi:hypothetical protein
MQPGDSGEAPREWSAASVQEIQALQRCTMTAKKIALFVLVVAAAALVFGCSKLTYERWETLNLQSSKLEVEAVLGSPDKYGWQKNEQWMYHDPDRQVTCTMEFVGSDKLTYTQWVDPEHGRREKGTAAIEGTPLIQRETGKTNINK